MGALNITVAIHQAEFVMLERIAAKRGVALPEYLRWLCNRAVLEQGRPVLPAPRISPRNWPMSVHLGDPLHAQFRALTNAPVRKVASRRAARIGPTSDNLPTAADLLRSLIHDDARRLGIMFNRDWDYYRDSVRWKEASAALSTTS